MRSGRFLTVGSCVMLITAGALAWLGRGPAILMELSTGIANLLCL